MRRIILLAGLFAVAIACEQATQPLTTLVVTTRLLSDARLTIAYSDTLVATGGDSSYAWSVTVGSLPTGLSLTTSTGL